MIFIFVLFLLPVLVCTNPDPLEIWSLRFSEKNIDASKYPLFPVKQYLKVNFNYVLLILLSSIYMCLRNTVRWELRTLRECIYKVLVIIIVVLSDASTFTVEWKIKNTAKHCANAMVTK